MTEKQAINESAQRYWRSMGWYDGPIDGDIGPKSRAAIGKYEEHISPDGASPSPAPPPKPPSPSSWRVAKSLDVLLAEINASAPGRDKANDGSIGDASHSERTSDHNPCRCHFVVCARDFTHDPRGGFNAHEFANWLADRIRAGQEPRVKYIISRGRIASGMDQGRPAGIWRGYSGSNPHDQHVHVSVRHGEALFDNRDPWGWHTP